MRKQPNVRQNFRNAITNNHNIIIPQVVDYELKRGFRIASAPKQEANYKLLLQECAVAIMDAQSWEYAEQVYESLYHKRLTVGELDMLIGAFCLAKGYTLVTNNISDFINMDELKLMDWVQPSH